MERRRSRVKKENKIKKVFAITSVSLYVFMIVVALIVYITEKGQNGIGLRGIKLLVGYTVVLLLVAGLTEMVWSHGIKEEGGNIKYNDMTDKEEGEKVEAAGIEEFIRENRKRDSRNKTFI